MFPLNVVKTNVSLLQMEVQIHSLPNLVIILCYLHLLANTSENKDESFINFRQKLIEFTI